MINLVECQPSFRLWISAEPHPKFPIGLLQMSIKITNEAPAGVRAGLKGSYAWVSQDMLDAVSQPQWKSMLYSLCFMHTIVQERRKFGPLGFNIPYEFNQSDLSACVQFMNNHLNDMETKKRPVDWIVVNYMVCMVQYGGRITDDWDRRLFNTYGKAWLTQQCLDPTFEFHEGYIVPANKPTYPGTEIADYRKYVGACPSRGLLTWPSYYGRAYCTGTSRTYPLWTTPRSSGCTATPTSPTAPPRPRPCWGPSSTYSPRRAAAAVG